MNTINHNLNNYELNPNNTIGFKADALSAIPQLNRPKEEIEQLEVELPDMYYMPENYKKPKTFVDSIKKIDLLGLIHPWFEHPLLMFGTCAGLSMGVDAFDKSCNKEYEKSIVGKAAKFGDKIEQSSLVQNDTSKSIIRGIKKGWNKIKTSAMKNDVIYSMFKTPSEPEWAIPKDELKHTNYRIVTKFKELAAALDMVPGKESMEGLPRRVLEIKELALDKDEIQKLKEIYKVDKISQIPEKEVSNRIMLQRLGKSEAEISKIIKRSDASDVVAKELLKKSGLTAGELEAIFKDESGETFELVKKASGNLRGVRLAHGKIVIPGPRQPFANVEGFEGIYNRAHSLSDGAATKTGRFMSKLVQKIYRGFTFGNQKQAVLIWVTPFLGASIINTIKADKKEKIGTAANGFINAFSWVFTFPLALMGIHAFGGIQYAGMGKEKVEEYKNIVKEFNDKVNAHEFNNISEYRAAKKAVKKQLRELRKVKNQNLLTETLRGLSRFSKADLLKLESFKNGSESGNLLRKLPNLIKDYVIYAPGRMIVFLFVGLAFADKIIDKTLSLIFGKPYDGFKDDELKNSKQKQEEYSLNDLRSRLVDIQRDKLYPKEEKIKTASNDIGFGEMKAALVPPMMYKLADEAESATAEADELSIANTDAYNAILQEEEEPTDIVPSTEINEELKEIPQEPATNEFEELMPDEEQTEQYKNAMLYKATVMSNPLNSVHEEVPVNEEEIPAIKEIELPEYNAIPEEKLTEYETYYKINEEPQTEFEEYDELTEEQTTEARHIGEITAEELSKLEEAKEELNESVEESIIKGEQYSAHERKNNSNKNKGDNYTYIPSSENIINQLSPTQPIYKYIPAQTGIQVNKIFDNSGLEAALKRADRAEKKALDALAGNFGNL